ncbi:hypothetical protein A6V39_05110 [Candidatus Mycoplasma haematobovis]|uniref:Uncharacterized protein n=1 Tax=Candidatus Mycoplasma haematobovis TaxID=432608 RepID=A0A1A9QBG9_9MOLU|nr:hypothetical protein [Candidatus Mycoplasma haematobovis]OAL09807.1 hypothetical protein A6V39_05110 [Candidatus Mycoplasma haematobovis]
MALQAKLPIIVATSSVAVGGGVYCCYQYSLGNKGTLKSFADYSEAFLKVGEDNELWSAKLKALENGNVSGHLTELQNAKNRKDLALLKLACEKFYAPDFVSKGEGDFLDFKNYCAKNNKDVVGTGWISNFESVDKSEKVIKKINERGDTIISSSLIIIGTKHAEKAKEETARTDLNKWCKDTGESIYLGEQSLDLKTGKEYCKEPT